MIDLLHQSLHGWTAPEELLGPDYTDLDDTELDEVTRIFLEDAEAERKFYEEIEAKREAERRGR